MAKLIKCKICDAEIASNAKACPQCGAKKKKPFHKKWWFWVIVVIIGLGIISSTASGNDKSASSNNKSAPSNSNISSSNSENAASNNKQSGSGSGSGSNAELRPSDQIAFEEIILAYKKKFGEAKNELQESVSRKERKEALEQLGITRAVNWVGTIDTLGTNSDGKAYVKIKINSSLSLGTWNNALSDLGLNTLINMDSQLYSKLIELSKGAKIRFSCDFITNNKDDYLQEKSVTIRGAMTNAEFLMVLRDITSDLQAVLEDNGNSQVQSESMKEDKPQQSSSQGDTKSTVRFGDTGSVDKLELTVNSVRLASSGTLDKPKEGNVFYILDVTINNPTSKAEPLSSLLQMSLEDNNGYSFDQAIFADTSGSLDGEVGEGRKKSGEVAFEVPKSATGLEFKFSPILGGSTYFDVPSVWEAEAINDFNMTHQQMYSLRAIVAETEVEITKATEVKKSNIMGNVAFNFDSKVGKVQAQFIEENVIIFIRLLDDKNIQVYYINEDIKAELKKELGDNFNLDTMIITMP